MSAKLQVVGSCLWNDACEQVFGDPPRRRLGSSIEALVPDLLKEGDLDSGAPVELPAADKHGRPLVVRLTLTAVSGDGLPSSYAMVVVRDVTERRRAEAELQRAHDALSETVAQLERRTKELTLIRELGELLSTCGTVEEFGEIIRQIAPQLFPTEAGALYLLATSRTSCRGRRVLGTGATGEIRTERLLGAPEGPHPSHRVPRRRSPLSPRRSVGSAVPLRANVWTGRDPRPP